MPLQRIAIPSDEVQLFVKREDLLHPSVPGNKWRKLKYNLKQAQSEGLQTLLTFGGAYSNHIAAVASAGRLYGFKTVGIIRGEELADKVSSNPTLSFAQKSGMQLEFISRSDYRNKADTDFVSRLKQRFGSAYILPEGGTNALAVKGCEEIL